jgi:thioredoxin-like negative regulator of GroEL
VTVALILCIRPSLAQTDKGLTRNGAPAVPAAAELDISPDEAKALGSNDRLLQLAQQQLKLSKEGSDKIFEHLKAADGFDVDRFRRIDDELSEIGEKEDAVYLESQQLCESEKSPEAAKWLAKAREYLKTAKLNLYKSSAIFYLCFGQPMQSAQRSRLALEMVDANKHLKPLAADVSFWAGAASLWSGYYSRAQEQLQKAVAADSKVGFAANYLGDAYIARGEMSKAIDSLVQARRKASSAESRAQIDKSLALAYALNKQPKLVQATVMAARADLAAPAPKQFHALADEASGVVSALNGEYERANGELTKALTGFKVSPIKLGNLLEAAQSALWRSYCRLKLGDPAGAAEDRQYAMSFSQEAPYLITLAKILDPHFGYTGSLPISEDVHDKWALVIGVSDFKDKAIPKLRYSAKDAGDLTKFLVEEGGFKPGHVKALIETDATKSAITDALGSKWLATATKPGDLIVVFISSHGTPAYREIGALNSVVTYDTRFDQLFSTSLPMQSIVRAIQSNLKGRYAFVVLDTCYAGGLGAPGAEGKQVSNADPDLLLSSQAQLLISSSDSDERSWESKRYPNSVFTRQLIDTLKKNASYHDFHAVFSQLRSNVADEVLADYKVSQKPKLSGRWSGKGLMYE